MFGFSSRLSSLSTMKIRLVILLAPVVPLRSLTPVIDSRSKRPCSAGARMATCLEYPAFIPIEVNEIQEPAALDMLSSLKRVNVPTVDSPGVPTSYYRAKSKSSFDLNAALSALPGRLINTKQEPVLLLLHGFDSSCLEFRRLVRGCYIFVLGCGPLTLIFSWMFRCRFWNPSMASNQSLSTFLGENLIMYINHLKLSYYFH